MVLKRVSYVGISYHSSVGEPKIISSCTYVGSGRGFSEESTLKLVTPILDLDTFWIRGEGVYERSD
jgi:hypothetical protein